ncbi:polyphenol oxidase family protein [Deltaproteobacteria bacterium OttesenSCG-928-M10]|nr:polyphenol oxidase family protein [Deltaproteobacteria bacterium OttesenSCG-928-M10]
MLKTHHQNGLTWQSFSIFDAAPELTHGVFTRAGGVSGPNGSDLNLAFSEADPVENVRRNLRRAETVLGLAPVAFVRQTHSDRVTVVRPGDHYRPQGPEDLRQNYDAMIAPEAGVGLLIKIADCQGVILYDPVSRVLGLVHSGWRGSVQNILGRTVEAMAACGVRPADILAAVSPSLGPCCAEFRNYRTELPASFEEFMTAPDHFDFWAISRRQLIESGLTPRNVETAGICTKCSPEFFSYRRGDRWGRFGIMAGVKRDNHESAL